LETYVTSAYVRHAAVSVQCPRGGSCSCRVHTACWPTLKGMELKLEICTISYVIRNTFVEGDLNRIQKVYCDTWRWRCRYRICW